MKERHFLTERQGGSDVGANETKAVEAWRAIMNCPGKNILPPMQACAEWRWSLQEWKGHQVEQRGLVYSRFLGEKKMEA